MSCGRATSLNPNNVWVLLRILPISSPKLTICSMADGISSHQFVSSFHTCITSKPMSYFLCKKHLFGVRNLFPISKRPDVCPFRLISSGSDQHSFTVSYLVKSLGFSPQSALLVSKDVSFKTPEKADKVINLFKNYGFNHSQISSLLRRNRKLLLVDAERIILPKLEFFKAKGILGPEMAKKLSTYPAILGSSLDKKIRPAYDFFRSFFQSDEKVIRLVKRFPDIPRHNIEKYVSPNIDILRANGVPDDKVATFMLNWPMSFLVSPDSFRKIVEKVDNIGFEPSSINYSIAVTVFQTLNESKWQTKVDVYKKWGWLEEDVLNAFLKYPWSMMLSEDKLMAGMDFFINQMGSGYCLIVKRPKLLSLSLKKRLIPRSSVFQVLLSRGLVKKEVSLVQLFECSENKFMQKFVVPYEKVAPEVLKLYEEKLNLSTERLVDEV